MRKKKDVSLNDIAQKAGVSIATVSRVINKKGNVNAETKKYIEQLLMTSGYTIAGTEDKPQSFTIAIFVPDLSNPFNVPVLDGIRKSARNSGYKTVLIIAKEKDTNIDYYLDLISDLRIKGIVSLSAFPNSETLLALNRFIPVVMCSEQLDVPEVSYVTTDDEKAAYNATEYLIKQGRKNIIHVNSTLNHKYARCREAGYRRALTDYGLLVREEYLLHLSTINYQLALSQIVYLLEHFEGIDGVFASSDIFAAATIEAARKNNKKVPEDIAVVGFDNISLASIVSPKLTTVEQPAYEIGFQACEILKEKFINEDMPEKKIILYTNLIIREST